MIRYLNKEEYGKCRWLWKEAFPDDSEEFGDYYFSKKLPEGRVLVREDEAGAILTMAHLNPYEVAVADCRWQLDYIVGVATARQARHQGHMAAVLLRLLQDENRDKKPFCYLMPASPDIYRPFGFAYIFDQPRWEPDEEHLEAMGLSKRELRLDEEPERLAQWMNGWLKQRYEVYAMRDVAYMKNLQAELDCELGAVQGWFDDRGDMAAMKAVWGIAKREQRFFYCRESVPAGGISRHPAIMARVTNVQAFLKPIRINEDCPGASMEVLLHIKDPLIAANAGLWRWRLDEKGSMAERVEVFSGAEQAECAVEKTVTSTEALNLSIDQLAVWLSGYRPLADILEEEPPFWCGYVSCLQGVFLDEVV